MGFKSFLSDIGETRKRSIGRTLAVTALFFLGISLAFAGTPWFRFRADLQSTGQGAASSATGVQMWSFPTRSFVFSSPSLYSNGVLYEGSADRNLYALNASNGQEVWSYTTGGTIYSTPAIGSKNLVFFGSDDGNVYAVDATTGVLKWKYTTGGPVGSSAAEIDQIDTLYIGSDDGCLYAIDADDGHFRWKFQTGGKVISTPCVDSNGNIYFGSEDGNVYALTHDGHKLWSFATNGPVLSSPCLSGDSLYIGSNDDNVYSLDADDGELNWAFTTGGAVISSPTVDPFNLVYVGSMDGNLYALYKDGDGMDWKFATHGPVQSSPAFSANGNVYIGSEDGTVYAVQSGALGIWSFKTNGQVNSSPSIGLDGTIYFGSNDGNLYAVGTPSITGFYASPSTVVGGRSSRGVFQQSAPASSGEEMVLMGSTSAQVTVPGSVQVPAGKTGVSFPITTSPVSSEQVVTITAFFGSASVNTTITVEPYPISNFYASPNAINSGMDTHGVIQLPGVAGSGGITVNVSSNNSALTPPATVTVPAGSKGVSFAIGSTAVSVSQIVTLTATLGNSVKTTSVIVDPYPISNFYVSPFSPQGGHSASAVVQLTGPAGPSGDVVSVSSSDPSVTVPDTVTVPAGSTGVSFEVLTSPVSNFKNVTLTATYGSSVMTALLVVAPVPLYNFYVSPSPVTGGQVTFGVIQLGGKAGAGGVVVSLSASTGINVPATVTVPAGKTGVSFEITTAKVTTSTTGTILASTPSTQIWIQLTVNP